MSEGVRTDFFRNACLGTVALHDVEHHDAAQLAPEAVEENVVLKAMLDVELVAEGKAVAYLAESRLGYGHYALLASFAEDRDITLIGIDVGEPQLYQLRHAKSARIESLEYRPVALSVAGRRIGCRNNPIDLFDRKHYRQMFAKLGRLDKLCRVIFGKSVEQGELVERSCPDKDALLRTCLNTKIRELRYKFLNIILFERQQCLSFLNSKALQLANI